MAKESPPGYGSAWETAQSLLRKGRLADPNEHFPYKHANVIALVEENGPVGPAGPDDDQVLVEDHMSREIADATKRYIDAQSAYLTDPGDGTRADYDASKDALQKARAQHRANRPAGPVVTGIRARRAGER